MTAKNEQERALAIQADPMIQKAQKSLERLSQDPDTRTLAYRRQLALDGYLLELGAAREEGLEKGMEKGLEKGMAKGSRKTLLTQLRLKFRDTLPDNIEERLTNATDSQIDRLTEQIISAKTVEELFAAE